MSNQTFPPVMPPLSHQAACSILELLKFSSSPLVMQAIFLAHEAHRGQTREGGEPHVEHVLRVALASAATAHRRRLDPTVPALVGILHDTLEDTTTTDQELTDLFSVEVTRLVRALSHVEEEEPDEVYLARVAQAGPIAVLVKYCDKLDNLRSLELAPAEFRRRKIAETRAALPIWRRIYPSAVGEIARILYLLEVTCVDD